MTETFTFKAEIQQLLHILVHSLYSEREIFLRELVSNASDALNRLQFERLTNPDIFDAEAAPEIRLLVDESAGTLTVRDTGIGMSREDLVSNLGTIARSGAKAFIDALRDKPDGTPIQDVIGQFGVGFYSVFMVADKVRVVTRSHLLDGQAWAWESDGSDAYSVEPAERDIRGTDIIIHLKDEAKEYLKGWTLKEIIRKHSNYIAFPIFLDAETEPINEQQAIWRKSKSDISDEDYNQFYRMFALDFEEPLFRIHMQADTPLQFYTLLYIPATRERSVLSPRKEAGLKLYARKVLIEDYNKGLLPEYLLQMVQGVVDSEDIPLNVSRETLKADAVIAQLKKTLTGKILGELKRMAAKRPEEYLKIFDVHGRMLKQGVAIEQGDRADLLPLLFFPSTQGEDADDFYSLADYAARMVPGQEDIYYLIGNDYTSTRRSPHLDAFKQRGIEVLFFTDPIDPIMVMGLEEYEGHKFRSADDRSIDLNGIGELKPEEESENAREALPETDFNGVIARFKELLGERVKDVVVGTNLVSSPARLVSDEDGRASNMFRVNRLFDRETEMPVKTLELNPRHPLLHNLNTMMGANRQPDLISAVMEQVFETAQLQDGIHPDPASMAARLYQLMQAATD
ncbi:MAG: molecular chaperone HtpG [Phototrophicaceae bacterium]